MARRGYVGTATLPGKEDTREASRAAPTPPARRLAPKRRFEISTPRLIAWSAAALVILGASLYAFHLIEQFLIRDPRFALHGAGAGSPSTFEIFGARHASLRAIESIFDEDLERSVYMIPLEDRAMTLRTVDWVRDASVSRVWPNHLLIHISERAPVAFLTLPSSRVALIDADGVILPPVADRFQLPVLAGVTASDSVVERRAAVARMLALLDELGEDGAAISEVDVSDADNIVVSQPYAGSLLHLMLGDRNYAVRYGNFLNHYEDIRTRLPGATVLDLRLENRITVVE